MAVRQGYMMLCYFNLAGAVYDPDVEGHEMQDIGHARVAAAQFLADVLKEKPELAWKGEELRVEVTNDDRLILCTVIVLGIDAAAAGGASPPA